MPPRALQYGLPRHSQQHLQYRLQHGSPKHRDTLERLIKTTAFPQSF